MPKTCLVNGCDNPVKARGCCGKHYLRLQKYGDPERKIKVRKKCKICDNLSVAQGLCDKHYRRFKKVGDPEYTKRPDDWGERTKHPLNHSWCWTARVKEGRVPEWDDFYKFLEDVGPRPSNNHRLVRIDADKPFGPDNIYWRETTPSKDKSKYQQEWAKKNPLKAKNIYLKKSYNIGIDEYLELLHKQGGVCAVCGKLESMELHGKVAALAVDHNHETGKVRGLLCSQCNKGLGGLGDSIELLEKAIAYLKQYD